MIKGEVPLMSNYAEFKTALKDNGMSINNFYDISFEIIPGSKLQRRLIEHEDIDWPSVKELMKLYTDEASIPGIQMSTGEYRITNTPTLKYVYGSVFSETSFSFIMDANSQIKNVFDIWTHLMYSYTTKKGVNDLLPILGSADTNKFRTEYRDDYTIDITIIKYERHLSSNKNIGRRPYSLRQIIPDVKESANIDGGVGTGFYRAVPVHAVKLFKAFPSNVSSIALNSGTSELVKHSVTFEYETLSTTGLTDNDYSGFVDAVNGGISGTSILDFLFNT